MCTLRTSRERPFIQSLCSFITTAVRQAFQSDFIAISWHVTIVACIYKAHQVWLSAYNNNTTTILSYIVKMDQPAWAFSVSHQSDAWTATDST